ncbi:hypothetical protein MBLNU230_g7331t1 [Neophaeotheca triangularis]
MDFGGGDIVAGANLAFFIYSHCFTEELAADTRYRDFRTDIRGFKDTLDKLNLLLCNARYRQQVSWPDREVIGDFLDTLHACEELLERNKRFLLKRSNAFENLQHYLSQQEQRIADLRIRIKFHTDKVLLVLGELNFVLLGSIDGRADDILGLVEQSRCDAQEILHAVHRLGGTATEDEHFPSKQLEQRFQASLLQDAPIGEEADIPIAEGLAAACFAFQESENVQQPPQVQYLLFLKCRWLLERIQRGREYRAAKPGFYYVRVVSRLQQEIRTIARADVLTRLEDEQLLNLDPSLFRIWPLPAPIVVPDRLLDHEAPRPGEEEVARVSLAPNTPGEGRTMTIYKWSATDFRTEVHASRRDEKLIVSEDIDTCKHRLVPRYALPIQATPRLELSIVLQQKTRVTEKVYAFDSTQDLYAVQTALTGYEVLHDQQIARCRIESMRKIDFSGSVQLWKPATYSPTSGYANGCDSLPTRLSSMSSGSKTNGKVSSRPASSVTRTSEGWELRKVEPPTIMVFAKYKESRDPDQLAIIYVKLEPKIGIESVQSPKEMSVTIAKSSGKKLEVRYLMCGSDIHHQPNTSTFDIFPLCASEDRPCVKTRETRYLSLCFDTLEETLRFRNQLQKVLDDRDDHLATLEGVNFSRHGSMFLLKIWIGPPQPTLPRKTLRSALEVQEISQYFLDVRNDSDALFAHYRVRLAGVTDIQLLELAERRALRDRVAGLATCMERVLQKGQTKAEINKWKETKQQVVHMFDPRSGGSYQDFNVRPLPSALLDYCVGNVRYLPVLAETFESKLDGVSIGRVLLEFRSRLELSMSASYESKSRSKVYGPKGWSASPASKLSAGSKNAQPESSGLVVARSVQMATPERMGVDGNSWRTGIWNREPTIKRSYPYCLVMSTEEAGSLALFCTDDRLVSLQAQGIGKRCQLLVMCFTKSKV